MLEQIARHGGVRLEVVCEGDVEVDTHHTIEDVCLALGEAIRVALGDKAGHCALLASPCPWTRRARACGSIFQGVLMCVLTGISPAERVGGGGGGISRWKCAPTLSVRFPETMKAAIHVEVSGDNAHHMIEACFKAFWPRAAPGRARGRRSYPLHQGGAV